MAAAMSGSMPAVLPELSLNSTGAYAMSEPTLMTPLSRIALGSLSASGAALVEAVSVLPESFSLVWSPQAVSSRAPVTARVPTAASRVRAAVVRRMERAVMVGASGGWNGDADGSTRTHTIGCRDLV
jgi:hypothetical protein